MNSPLRRDFSRKLEPARAFPISVNFNSASFVLLDERLGEALRGSVIQYDARDSAVKAVLEIAIDSTSRFNNGDYIVLEPGGILDFRGSHFERLYVRVRRQWFITGDTDITTLTYCGKLIVSDWLIPDLLGSTPYAPIHVREPNRNCVFGMSSFSPLTGDDGTSGIWSYKARLHNGPGLLLTGYRYRLKNTGERLVFVTSANIQSGPVPQSGPTFDTLYAQMYPLGPGESEEFWAGGFPNTDEVSSTFNFLDLFSEYADAEVKYYRENHS